MNEVASPGWCAEPPLRDLLLRCHRGALHRLRGNMALLGGWIEVGVPPGSESRVRLRLEENAVLLARLDWLATMLGRPAQAAHLQAGEAPAVLLAAALGLNTPEEAGLHLPRIASPEAGLGVAVWLQMVAPEEQLGGGIQTAWEGRSWAVAARSPKSVRLEAWREAFGAWTQESGLERLLLRPGVLAPREEPTASSVGAAPPEH